MKNVTETEKNNIHRDYYEVGMSIRKLSKKYHRGWLTIETILFSNVQKEKQKTIHKAPVTATYPYEQEKPLNLEPLKVYKLSREEIAEIFTCKKIKIGILWSR